MEVHHHSHTARKKWTHYFWEFLMLFLAVTLGFFVENQREHYVEHLREKQFIYSLLEDLERDTAELKSDIPFWELQFKRIDSLRAEILKPENERNAVLLYRLTGYMRWYNNFLYHDRTISQLKNGGNFRLIRNDQVSDSLIEYDASVTSVLRDIEEQSNFLWRHLNFLQNKIFDTRYYPLAPYDRVNLDSVIRTSKKMILPRAGSDPELFEFFNQLNYFKGAGWARNTLQTILLNKATNLIAIIKKEYR